MAASTYFDQIQQLYIAYFGRPADPVGLNYWASQVDAANGSVAAVIAGFAASSESNALYAGVPTAQKVSAIYLNLFNRLPEAAGLAYWTQQIDSGTVTQAQAAYQIQSSAGPGDASAVANKLAMAKAFTAQIDTTAEITGYSGAIAAAYGRAYLTSVDSTQASVNTATSSLLNSVATATGTTVPTTTTPPVTPTAPVGATYVLTTASESLTGTAGDDTFTGIIDSVTPGNSTLNFKDFLDGGSGTDALTVTVQGAATATWPTVSLSNIEKLSIRDQHTGGGLSLYNLSGVTGLSTVASNVSTAAVSFTGLQTGTTVAVLGNKVTSVGNVAFNMANNSDTVSLLLDGGVQGAATISNTSTTATTATIASTGAANKVSTISLGGADSFSSLTINATTDLTATLQAADYKSTASLTVTGAGKVDLSSTLGFDGAKIDASANSGGLTIALSSSNIQTVVGSSGADRILGTSLLGSASSIDGGAGIDTMSASLVGAGNGAIFKNFELLDLGSGANSGALDVGQLSNSTITGVVLSGNAVAPTVVLNNVVDTPTGFNVNLIANSSSSNLTLNFGNVTGSNDVLNFNFSNVAGTQSNAGTVASQGIETINVKSGGIANSQNSLSIVDNALKSLVITGSELIFLTIGAQTGIGGASQLTSIDGSAATGNQVITVTAPASGSQAALIIKGGTGNDYFSVTTSAVSGSLGTSVTTGAGADTISLANATVRDASNPQFTTITDARTGDKLQFGGNNTFVSAAVPIAGGQTVTQALNTAADTANTTKWFVYGLDSYIVYNNSTVGIDAADIVVKVSGVTDLSGMTGGGTGTLTFV
ncbi:hypothetical protein M2401_003932 [Pseudomonas sp. JUb42]|uniref:DUF4214 domain-containing protein n=1 Tax=Pseudomonas sp. JUb42 TaxID=2940611 RepID=UPI002169C66E|nr:DUF4214 domain-containing protein [Pseudomonas sp. JUb42]MCS3470182.1 hypothetical protein [Pseudomonas sp. JUb42]